MEIIWSPRAVNNLDKISNFIALDNPSKAFIFVDELIESVERLQKFPESGMITKENPIFRQIVYHGYKVVYHLSQDSLSIITVIGPGQQNPT